jgi:hypothetical protein
MSYAGSIASGRFERARNIPKNIYVSPELLKDLWEPLQVPREVQTVYTYVSKRFDTVAKASAQHIREGLIYESRGIVLNNPLHPIEISGWGQLNNLSGKGVGILNKSKTPTSRTSRNAKITNRNSAFRTSIDSLRAEILHKVEAAVGKKPSASNVAGSKKNYEAAMKAWKAKVKTYTSKPENTHLQLISDNTETYEKGHKNLILFFKRGGYFIAPKLATLELRNRPDIFRMGKGEDYIELDGLIYDKKSNKVIILELKKEKGATGPDDAQQMRKAAALFRKWGLEIIGKVPTVEMYFSAGAAEYFAPSGYEFNLEKNASAQNWSPRHIQTVVSSASDHIVYIRTPIFLLTGIGLGDLLRIDPKKISQVRDALTQTVRELQIFSDFFEDKYLTNPDLKPYVIKRVGGTQATPIFGPAVNANFTKNEPLYLDIGRMAVQHPEFSKLVPTHWKPKATNLVPTMKLAKVAEGLLYINALKRKLSKPELNADKRTRLQKEYKNYHELLLSNRYSGFIKANQKAALKAELNRIGGKVKAGVNSPVQNTKFYSRIMKQARIKPVTYYKRATNTSKQAPSGNVKYGYTKVSRTNILPNYEFKKGANVNLGNISVNNVRNANNSTVIRWLGTILRNASNSSAKLPNGKYAMYNNVIKSVLATRSQNGASLKPKARELRNKIMQMARASANLLAGKKQIMGVKGSGAPPKTVRSNAGPSAAPMNENSAKNRILKRAREELSTNEYKKAFPRGAASVAKYVRETAQSMSVVNFARTVNQPGSIRPR